MKAKQPLFLVAFVAIMLVVLIIVPAVASAAPGGSGGTKPVNWVKASFVCNPTADIPVLTMDVIHVWKVQNGTVKGTYLDQSIGKAGEYSYRYSSRNFESQYWDTFQEARELDGLSHAYFCHGADYPDWLWPTYAWMGLPSSFATFANADIVDFVVYVPADQLGPASLQYLPAGADSLPLRYVLLDFGSPCRGRDRFMAWAFVPTGDPDDRSTFWLWYPMSVPDDPVAFRSGNIQVHVGASDF